MAFFQTHNLWVAQLADGVAELVLDAADSKTNTITPSLLADLEAAVEKLSTAGPFDVLVLRTAKASSFCHDLDPHWLAELQQPEAFADLARRGQVLCERLVNLRFPTIAIVSGACLGAGLELALACDYRVVVNKPTTSLGFTEVELGLMPCWGGTQRLPRLIGLETSFRLLLGGRRVTAPQALAIGLADALNEETDTNPPDFLGEPGKRDWSQFVRSSFRQRMLEGTELGRWLVFRGATRVLRERLPQDVPAPWEALEALRRAAAGDLDAGLAFEREAVVRLAQSPAFRNLLRLRFQREDLRGEVARPDPKKRFRNVGIIGAGATGVALLHEAALKGCQIVLHDDDKTRLGYAIFSLFKGIQDEVASGSLAPAIAQRCLNAIRGTVSWQHFDTLDLVIDTAGGDLPTRQQRFRHLDKTTSADAVLVSTDPVYTTAELREGLRRPERVARLHVIDPGGNAALAELPHAPGALGERLAEWTRRIGKMPRPVADVHGLLALRVLLPAFNEAGILLKQRMPAQRIDEAMIRFGLAHGPLEYMDQLGLDTIARLVEALRPRFAGRLPLESGFGLMVQHGWLGGSGSGFYVPRGKKRRPNRGAETVWEAESVGETVAPLPALSVADQLEQAQRRMVALMVLEAYHCLNEQIVDDADALDLAMVLAGWAPHRGGPLTYARQLGDGVFLARLAELARDHGPRFAPPPGLAELLQTAGKLP